MHPRLLTVPAFTIQTYWILAAIAIAAGGLFVASRRARQEDPRFSRQAHVVAWVLSAIIPTGLVALVFRPTWRVLTIPSWTLHTYGMALAIAFLAGLWVVSRQAKRAGLDSTRITDMAVWVLIAGLLGAKLLLVVVDWRYFTANPGELFMLFKSGGVFYGGLLGGILVAWWYISRHKLPAWQVFDVFAPAVVFGHAIGRWGCLAAGCCWGKPANVPWAVTFTDVYAARTVGTPLDNPLHPSQIYASLALFLIFLFLLWLAPRKKFHGQVILAYVTLYSAVRFGLEFLRGDPDRGSWFRGALSTSQLIAIILILGAALLLPRLLRTQPVEKTASP